MKQEEEKSVGLPDNAFRPLKPGEQYQPIMSPNKKYPEVNLMGCGPLCKFPLWSVPL